MYTTDRFEQLRDLVHEAGRCEHGNPLRDPLDRITCTDCETAAYHAAMM